MWRVLLAALLFAMPAQAHLDRYPDFKSAHVLARHVIVWTPDDYDPKGPPLPVLYMHDGQNVFEASTANFGVEWAVDEALTRMKRRAIVVGSWSTKLRGREYLPAKVAALLPEDTRQRVEAVHGGPSLADAYLRFLVEELKPFIDKTYRTLPDAAHTSIMGSSMGGLISLYALAEYPQVFGQAAALSVHWPLADPTKATPEEADQVASAFKAYLASSRVRPGVNRLYMDHGSVNLDSFYRPYSTRMEAILPALGWVAGESWVSRVYEGTDRNEAAWAARVEIPLGFLLPPAGQ